MNLFRNIRPAAALGALSLLLLPAAQSFGQTTATTDPVGYTALTLPANSDSLVSIPFTRPAAFVGAIGSISGSTITTASSPGWTASQYKYLAGTQSNTYYAIIGPLLTTVSGTVTVTNGSPAVSATGGLLGIKAGDEFIVNGLAYNVAADATDTALTLSRAFTGASASGQTATFDHSPKEGAFYTVTDNGTNTLTVSLNGDSLGTVLPGTTVSLIPYWTIGTAFPASDVGVSYIATTNTKSRATQILLPDQTSAGINLATAGIYYYYNNAWTAAGSSSTATPSDIILPPSSYFTVRNAASGTTFTPTGAVVMNRISTPLDTAVGIQQDNAVSVPRPASVTLNDLGLISSGAFATSSGKTRADQLLVYDNVGSGINKSAKSIYYYDTAWRAAGGDGSDVGATLLPYGVGLTIRKASSTTGATAFWQNTRNY